MKTFKLLFLLLPLALLTSCGTATRLPRPPKTPVAVPSPIPAPTPTAPSSIAPAPVPSKPPTLARIPATQRPNQIDGKSYYPLPTAEGYTENGIASWYGDKFHGRLTSNGETYDMFGPTAAHKTLPMNTQLLVKNLENNKELVVRINDRGPFVQGRIIDLSLNSARQLGIAEKGTAKVSLTALGEAVPVQQNGETLAKFAPHQNFEQGDFYVQIGSFTNPDNAERLKNTIMASGRKAVTETYATNEATFYRVQVSGGQTLTEAKQLESRLAANYPGAFVIAR